jgi:hypothetical protein
MPSSIPDDDAWVGLDWADQQHEGRLQAVGSSQVEPFVLLQRPETLQEWVGQLRTRFPFGRMAIAVEQSRGPLVYVLMGYDFLLLYPVPPIFSRESSFARLAGRVGSGKSVSSRSQADRLDNTGPPLGYGSASRSFRLVGHSATVQSGAQQRFSLDLGL